MKKSAKLSLTLALMMGITGGVQLMDTNQASAEISDKFRIELNGVTSYVHDSDDVSFTYIDSNGRHKDNYWNNYTRVQLNYYLDKSISYQARLNSNYDTVGDFLQQNNKSGAYFDQSWLQIKDLKGKTTYIVGKTGAYMGQGMTYNASGKLTGGKIQIGNWWDPNNICFIYGDRDGGDKVFAANGSLGLAKNVTLSALYLRDDKSNSSLTSYTSPSSTRGLSYVTVGNTRIYEGQTAYTSYAMKARDQYKKKQLAVFGLKAKMPGVTIVGEHSHNMNGAMSGVSGSRRGWYVEAYTGPTSDMTSGLPLQKPGTNVWSLKYQDIGTNSTVVHNTTFFDGYKGFRLNYGHTFRKGLSADIAYGRYKDKVVGSTESGARANSRKWNNIVVAEVCYKFR